MLVSEQGWPLFDDDSKAFLGANEFYAVPSSISKKRQRPVEVCMSHLCQLGKLSNTISK